MPFIECHITTGLSDRQKRQLLQKIVAATREAIDDDPRLTNVVLHEHPAVNLSVSGRIESEAKHVRKA
jgi:4-oxalocrotonate tautomerase family enzyme